MTATRELSRIQARNVRPLEGFNAAEFRSLPRLGIGLDERCITRMMAVMDALQPTVTTGSVPTPIQFLQEWLPGFVFIITAARNIDKFVGINTVGTWEMEEVVQSVLERTGTTVPYGDYTNVPLSSWNVNFERRTVVRFEEGMQVGILESLRAARMQLDDSGAKREAAALALEIRRNQVGFFGFNNGANRTYGFLNDPNLPAYVSVPSGVSGSPLWSRKTYLEIVNDILTTIQLLRTSSKDTIDPKSMDLTLAIDTDSVDYLSTSTDFGYSVSKWLQETYPRIRVQSAPELSGANGGANVFYLYADKVDDASTDGGQVFIQAVPSKFQMLGVQQLPKAYVEDYSNASAGIMLKRPFAVIRRSGI